MVIVGGADQKENRRSKAETEILRRGRDDDGEIREEIYRVKGAGASGVGYCPL